MFDIVDFTDDKKKVQVSVNEFFQHFNNEILDNNDYGLVIRCL